MIIDRIRLGTNYGVYENNVRSNMSWRPCNSLPYLRASFFFTQTESGIGKQTKRKHSFSPPRPNAQINTIRRGKKIRRKTSNPVGGAPITTTSFSPPSIELQFREMGEKGLFFSPSGKRKGVTQNHLENASKLPFRLSIFGMNERTVKMLPKD